MPASPAFPLDAQQIERFVTDGAVRLDQAFPAELAAQARDILWRDMPGLDPQRPETWTRPVVRLGHYTQAPFVQAANTPALRAAFDQLIGPGRWRPCGAMGSFPVRFPSGEDAGDTGWHIDPGFHHGEADFMQWRSNVHCAGRPLLLLFLFSDVGEDDAPTRLRLGSHRDIARRLAPAGEAGLTLAELAAQGFALDEPRTEALATGPAGTVYLCHPLLVHRAQAHHGRTPRFLAQPTLPFAPGERVRLSGGAAFPLDRAVRDALRPGAAQNAQP